MKHNQLLRLLTRIIPFLLITLIFFTAVWTWQAQAYARMGICTVPSGQYATLADAVADASCTAIHVQPGTHSANVTIGHDLAILGAGADQTILDGGQAGRVINTGGNSVTISGVTIANGLLTGQSSWGAAIYNDGGQLTLTDSRVTNNQAEAAGGLVNSAFSGGGTAVVTNVEFSGNQATNGIGSAISNIQGGRLTLTNVTISGNHAVQYAATVNGRFSYMEINYSSVVSNTSNGGGSSTGINNHGTLTMTNSIVAGNGNGTSNCGGGGIYHSADYNLEDDDTCRFDEPNDLIYTNPQVGPLANNGGASLTHALLAGSPAIDSGTNAGCPTTDQRNAPRPVNNTCDRGAFEFDGAVPNPTPTATATTGPSPTATASPTPGPSPTPTPTNTPVPDTWYVNAASGDDGNSCLNPATPCEHINSAIGKAGPNHTIHIAAGTYVENVVVDKALTLVGAGADLTILDGGQAGRTLFVDWTGNATVSGVTIQNGRPPQNGNPSGGGGILNIATLNLSHSRVVNNEAPNGGGILNRGTLNLSHVEISGNMATEVDGGGGIRADSTGQVTMLNVTISGNSATSAGAGIGNWGDMDVTNITVANNSGTAGVFNASGGTLTMQNSLLDHTAVPNCTLPNLTSAGYNLESGNDCGLSGPGDQTMAVPRLVPLDFDGALQIHALLGDSPAIDAGTNSGCPATDQRGMARPIDGNGSGTAVCDIGAYEAELLTTLLLPYIGN